MKKYKWNWKSGLAASVFGLVLGIVVALATSCMSMVAGAAVGLVAGLVLPMAYEFGDSTKLLAA